MNALLPLLNLIAETSTHHFLYPVEQLCIGRELLAACCIVWRAKRHLHAADNMSLSVFLLIRMYSHLLHSDLLATVKIYLHHVRK